LREENRLRVSENSALRIFGPEREEDLFGRPDGNRSLGIPRRRWEDNINMELMELGVDGAK
jgi:hypothetical protein